MGIRTGVAVVALVAVVAALIFGYAHRSRLTAAWRHRVMGQPDVQIAIGKPFPALDLVSPDGTQSRYVPAMGKVTVVNVFATWCPPCRAESPAYALFSKSAAARGVDIMAIDRAETAPKIDAYRREYDLTFPYLIDEGCSRRASHAGDDCGGRQRHRSRRHRRTGHRRTPRRSHSTSQTASLSTFYTHICPVVWKYTIT
jgi:thiol-disulfide isomerase/thioredoxin